MVLELLFTLFFSYAALADEPYVGRPVGIEFEYAGGPGLEGNAGYTQLLEWVREEHEGEGVLNLQPWNQFSTRNTLQGSYRDPSGALWRVVPEQMTGWNYDGYEFITPPLRQERDFQLLDRLQTRIQRSGLYVPGQKSSTHFTFDMTHLAEWHDNLAAMNDVNVSKLVDTILYLENNWPQIYGVVQPRRYGNAVNSYAVPLATNQPDLLRALAAVPPEERTYRRIREIFLAHQDYEQELAGNNSVHSWKTRAANYAKFFGLGEFAERRLPVFEIRIADLTTSPAQTRQLASFFSDILQYGHTLEPGGKFRDPFRSKRFENRSLVLMDFEAMDRQISAQQPEEIERFRSALEAARKSAPPPVVVAPPPRPTACDKFFAKFSLFRRPPQSPH